MQLRKLTAEMSVSLQITASDLSAIQTAGFRSIICNRPDGEGSDLPTFSEIEAADIVIVGAGAAGLATASSLLVRDHTLDIAVIDPADTHYYQPGWTMVGAGLCKQVAIAREMAAVLPRKVHWIKAAVAAFEPDSHVVILEGCRVVRYRRLIVCPGLKLDWHAFTHARPAGDAGTAPTIDAATLRFHERSVFK
ncbi:hypothetical protein LMG28138_05716 [Pararobbsia alpina]|uniref:Beta-lactamase hydrolase-like protein phosphatase-like domain-containing protein n=1 Tax=Pararobbsia alpina TaxID=621374 RepID=A0A6S7BMW8_9BURK|nr:hypothetical protein LMG28138_05716 [Pararobbsia alpina]